MDVIEIGCFNLGVFMFRPLKAWFIGSVYLALCFSPLDFNQLAARIADTRGGETLNRGGSLDNRSNMGGQQSAASLRDSQGRLRSLESPGDAKFREDWRGPHSRDWHEGNRGNYYGAPGYYGVPYPIYSNENYYGNPQGTYGYDSGYYAPNYGPTPYGQPAPYGQQVNPSGPINQSMNPFQQR